jgi:hypothetical protein
MNKFLIIAILAVSYVSAQRYRCMDKLDGSPAGKCLVIDQIGIHYVSSCKTGKVCDGDEFGAGWSQCTNFKLPGFDGQACSDNAECLSNNCDGGSCAEKDGYCINELACEKGRYCDSQGKCQNMKGNGKECYSSKECNPYYICNSNKCTKVGSLDNGATVDNDMDELEGLVCKGGIALGNVCDKITEDRQIFYDSVNQDVKMKVVGAVSGEIEVPTRANVLSGARYPTMNKKKSDLFSKYITEVNDNERDPDDGVWQFGYNRVTGDKKKVKEALIKYMYPELDDNDDDDEIECVRDYMQQIVLSSKSINVSKYLLLLVALFL